MKENKQIQDVGCKLHIQLRYSYTTAMKVFTSNQSCDNLFILSWFIEFHNNFIRHLKLANFAMMVSQLNPEKEAAISYIEGVLEKLQPWRAAHRRAYYIH